MSRITGNLAAATAFALLAAFLYLARDENGGWRTDRLCLTTSGITCPATATEDVHATDAKSNNSAQSDSKRGRKTKKKGSSSAPMPLPKELKDDATGIALPRTKRFSSKSDFTCLGVGVRAKSIAVAKVNVYTVGLYVDSKSARGALKKYSGLDPSQLRKDASLFKTLGQPGGFARYLHLVFARGLGAQKVVDALTAVKGVNDDVLSRFSTIVLDAIGKTIGKGESISLGWEGKDKMVVFVRDKMAGTVVDANLPRAIFDLYLGSSPISPPAKDAFAEGVPAFLAS